MEGVAESVMCWEGEMRVSPLGRGKWGAPIQLMWKSLVLD